MTEPRNPPPRYGTPRNPARKTLGGAVCKVMTMLGNPPLPWQRDALAVACEVDPDTGGYYYDTVIIVVLRRAGKTTISRAKLKHRALTIQDALMVYTAQNRLKALSRLRKDFYKPYARSPLAPALAKPRWTNGSEALKWKNGAELAIDAVGENSGHGDTLHEGHIDEAYAHVDSKLEDGMQPALMTVTGSQLWILSAAGTSRSSFLKGKVDLGRALVESGLPSRTCYIEYSADPDADPDDPETLLSTHPAVGYHLDADRIMAQRVAKDEDSLRGWERAWLGWWSVAKAPPKIVPVQAWEKNYVSPDEDAWDGVPFWAIDTSPDRDTTSIAMAARPTDPRATAYVELYETRMGTAGVVEQLVQLRADHGGNFVAVDGGGQAKSFAPELERQGFEVVKAPGPARVDACGDFYDDALTGKLRFVNDPELNKSMGNAVKQKIGDNVWIYGRGRSLGDITGMYAVTFARWLYRDKRDLNNDPEDSIL